MMRSKSHSLDQAKEKGRFASPLDAKKRDLVEQEQKLHQEIARRQQIIADAPRLAEEAARRRRDELIQRKSRTEARFASPVALNDPRYGFECNASAPPRQKTLRKHQNQGMFTFFVLVLVLAGVLYWLYYKMVLGQ